MAATAVYVGTTQGPVRITRLRADSGSFSVAMAHGTSRTLPISQHYHHFVEAGTGAVLRVFPRPPDGQFRIDFDVSPGLEITGDSWQLGAFVAHALLAAGALAQAGSEPAGVMERAVWCSGAMDPVERTVSAMSVGAKLMHPATAGVMQGLVDQGVDVLFLVPEGSAVEAKSAAVPGWIRRRVRPVRLADEACALAGAPLPAGSGGVAEKTLTPGARRWKIAAVAAGVAAAAAVGWAYWAEPLATRPPDAVPPAVAAADPALDAAAENPAPEAPPAPPGSPAPLAAAVPSVPGVRIVELRAPPGIGCPAVQEGAAVPDRVETLIGADRMAVSRHGGSLCGVEFVVDPDSARPFALLAVEAVAGDFADCDPIPANLLGAAPVEQEASWRCNVRQAPGARAASYRVSVARAVVPLGAQSAGAGTTIAYRIEP